MKSRQPDPMAAKRREVYRTIRAGLVFQAQAVEKTSGHPVECLQIPTLPPKLVEKLNAGRDRQPEGVTQNSVLVLVSQGDTDPSPRLLIIRDVTDDLHITMLAAEMEGKNVISR